MKSKNLLLIAVAVGCGLVAAFLTSQMSAKTREPVVETVDVPVAVKELPVGAKIAKEDLDACVTLKKMAKEALPPAFVATREELIDKRVTRIVRPGEPFNPADVSAKASVEIPPGFDMVSFPITPDKMVGGFAVPGSRVDLIATIPVRVPHRGSSRPGSMATPENNQPTNGSFIGPILVDMLVLAVDTAAQSTGGPVQQVSHVSIAVTKKQALTLHGLVSKTQDIRMVLRSQDRPPVYDKIPTEEEVKMLLGQVDMSALAANREPTEPEFKVVELPVPKEDIPAGTKLTEELLNTKFTVTKIVPPAPQNVVTNVRAQTGKFLTKDLTANQFIPQSFLADELPKVPEPKSAKAAPAESAGPKAAPDAEPAGPAPLPPVYWDVTVHTSNGAKRYRYQKLASGEYKYLGELRQDDTPEVEGATPEKPGKGGPKAAPDDAKKSDKLIRAD